MRRIAALLCGIALVALLVGIAGQFGRVSDAFDAVNFAAPFWLSGGIVAGIGALVLTQNKAVRGAAGIAIAGLAAIAMTLAPSWRNGPACPSDPLTLVQFNMFKQNAEVARAVAWVAGTRADVVLLEEASREGRAGERLRTLYPYQVDCLPPVGCSTKILSRHPFLASGGLARGDPENRGGLSAAWARIALPGGPATIVAAHLDRPWPYQDNQHQRDTLAAFVRRQGPAAILGGDFNLPAWTFQIAHLTRATGLARAPDVRSWPATATWPPLLAIDHVFAGRAWTVTGVTRGPILGSDHYPLIVKLCRR